MFTVTVTWHCKIENQRLKLEGAKIADEHNMRMCSCLDKDATTGGRRRTDTID